MTKLPQEHHAEAVTRAEALIERIHVELRTVLDGLADRPKPGAKQKAREALVALLTANHEVHRFIESKMQVEVVCSGDDTTGPSDAAP